MPVTIAPSDEACQALVSRINSGSGGAYTLPTAATYSYDLTTDVTQLATLRVDVIHVNETDLNDTLDTEDPTSHDIQVWVRQNITGEVTTSAIAALKLIVRKLYQRLRNYETSRIWVAECNVNADEQPDKTALRTGQFSGVITLRVEVEASP